MWRLLSSVQSKIRYRGPILLLVALSRVSHARGVKVHPHVYPGLVILRPWMRELQFTPFHILNLFPGFTQYSLILACAGLFKVRLFPGADCFPEESSSGISPAQLSLSPAGTGRP